VRNTFKLESSSRLPSPNSDNLSHPSLTYGPPVPGLVTLLEALGDADNLIDPAN